MFVVLIPPQIIINLYTVNKICTFAPPGKSTVFLTVVDYHASALHFFSVKIPQKTKTGFGQYRKRYLGFIVIRPTDLQRMGRTILTPPITDPHTQFVHCQTVFTAHILGEEFRVKGMPFTQQDTQVGACAQASLWMLARYMSRRFGYREFLPAEINQLAKAHLAIGRPMPADRGLNSIQMLDALQGMGFSALSYSRTAVDDCSPHIARAFPVDPQTAPDAQRQQREVQRIAKLADITYRYIESGLPVILGTANHALVAIGHTYDPAKAVTVAIQRIPAFLVNNDNAAPYGEMPLFGPSPSHLSFLEVQSILAVVPPEVALRGEEAEAMAAACIEKFLTRPWDNHQPKTYRDWITDNLRPDRPPACRTWNIGRSCAPPSSSRLTCVKTSKPDASTEQLASDCCGWIIPASFGSRKSARCRC